MTLDRRNTETEIILQGSGVWRKTYGFDFVFHNPGNGSRSEDTECYLDCLRAEHSRFARRCRRRGGVFKCCMSGWD